MAGLHQLDLGPENRWMYWRSLGATAADTKNTEPIFPLLPAILKLKTTPDWKATVFYWHAAKECCGTVLWVLCTTYRQTAPAKTLVAKTGLSAEDPLEAKGEALISVCLFIFFLNNCLSTAFSQVVMKLSIPD